MKISDLTESKNFLCFLMTIHLVGCILYFLFPENDLSCLSRRLSWKHTFHSLLSFRKTVQLTPTTSTPRPHHPHHNHTISTPQLYTLSTSLTPLLVMLDWILRVYSSIKGILRLGEPTATRSAVFLNIVQKAFDPPPPSFWTSCCKFFWWIS